MQSGSLGFRGGGLLGRMRAKRRGSLLASSADAAQAVLASASSCASRCAVSIISWESLPPDRNRGAVLFHTLVPEVSDWLGCALIGAAAIALPIKEMLITQPSHLILCIKATLFRAIKTEMTPQFLVQTVAHLPRLPGRARRE